jgi:hypothetical protein
MKRYIFAQNKHPVKSKTSLLVNFVSTLQFPTCHFHYFYHNTSTESPQPVQTAVQPASVPVEAPVVAIPVTPTKVLVKEIEMYTPAAASDDWLTQYDADFFSKLALMACNQSEKVCDPVVAVHQPLFTLSDCQLFTECSY